MTRRTLCAAAVSKAISVAAVVLVALSSGCSSQDEASERACDALRDELVDQPR